MPKMIVSIDGVVIKEVQLIKDRTSLGRRPYNDVVIDHLAVSGEHAVLQMSGANVLVVDLNSTNGTYVNGKAVKKQLLQNNDTVEISKYKIKYVNETAGPGLEKPTMINADSANLLVAASSVAAASVPVLLPDPAPAAISASGAVLNAAIKLLSGAAAGREVSLVKAVTTIGKAGVAVAVITKRPHDFVIAHVEGVNKPLLNGVPVGVEAVALKNGD